MKTQALVLLLPALLVGALALVPGDVARADDKARSGVWVFDVRIVRVDPATPEGAETVSLFEETDGTTVPMGWPQILETLKKRGTTRLLMDQRITTMDGFEAQANSTIEHPTLMVNTSDDNNTRRRTSTVKTGCKFKVTPTAASMKYEVEALWALAQPAGKDSVGPRQLRTSWSGYHPPLAGDTLVLHYREQVGAMAAGAPKAVELYAVVTGRFVAK